MCNAREVVLGRVFRDIAAFPLSGTGPFNGKCRASRPLGDLGTPTLSAKGALWPYGLLSTHWKFIRRMLLCDVVLFIHEVVHLTSKLEAECT